jgi:hypothetical protein
VLARLPCVFVSKVRSREMTRVMRLGLEGETRKSEDVVEGGTVEREYASDRCFEGGLIYPFGDG